MLRFVCKAFADLSPYELYEAMHLRQAVFCVEQNCIYNDADGKDLKGFHLMGYVDNDLAAYARLLPKGVSYEEASIGRVITSIKYRGKGLGKELMEVSIEKAEALYGKGPIRIGAQAYLKKFYEEFGFVDQDEPYLEDGIPHLIMLRP